MYELCGKVRDLEPYEPIKGTYRIRLDANESFYNMPDEIKQEIKDIIDVMPFNRYPDSTAEKPIKAFAEYYGISPENVTASRRQTVLMKCFIYWRLPCWKEIVW